MEISIHAPAKGATSRGNREKGICKFQSTLPRRERLRKIQMMGIIIVFQSTLPRRERLDTRTVVLVFLDISIHAPAKGATTCIKMFHSAVINFNPRSREGSDLMRSVTQKCINCISIHAPAKGATIQQNTKRRNTGISIHAPAKGATIDSQISAKVHTFQSTLPRRERLIKRAIV